MRPRRSAPRINLSFQTLSEMDDVERQANLDGLNLQNWLRQLVREEMSFRRLKKLLIIECIKSLLIVRYILEQLVDESKIRAAEDKAERKIERLDLQSKHL